MSQSHTGRNGTLYESQQTVEQRTSFNRSFDVEGQSSLVSNIFQKSPIHLTSTEMVNLDESEDRASFFTTNSNLNQDGKYKNLREDFSLLRSRDVIGGFGFGPSETISMSYEQSPEFSDNGIANVEKVESDVHQGDAATGTSLVGHPNLTVSGFNTLDFDSSVHFQTVRNDDLPGSHVDASQGRLDNISQYFKGAGNRV